MYRGQSQYSEGRLQDDFDIDEGLDFRQFEYGSRAVPMNASENQDWRQHNFEQNNKWNGYAEKPAYGQEQRQDVNRRYQDNIILRTHPNYDIAPYDENPYSPPSQREVYSRRGYREESAMSLKNERTYSQSVSNRSTYRRRDRLSTSSRSHTAAENTSRHQNQGYDHPSVVRGDVSRQSQRSSKQLQTEHWVDKNSRRNSSKSKHGETYKRFQHPDPKGPFIPLPDYEGSTVQYVPEPDY